MSECHFQRVRMSKRGVAVREGPTSTAAGWDSYVGKGVNLESRDLRGTFKTFENVQQRASSQPLRPRPICFLRISPFKIWNSSGLFY